MCFIFLILLWIYFLFVTLRHCSWHKVNKKGCCADFTSWQRSDVNSNICHEPTAALKSRPILAVQNNSAATTRTRHADLRFRHACELKENSLLQLLSDSVCADFLLYIQMCRSNSWKRHCYIQYIYILSVSVVTCKHLLSKMRQWH